jgi:hypothetical protein
MSCCAHESLSAKHRLVSVHASIHLLLHGLVPLAVAWLLYRTSWLHAWLIMVSTMIVDLDHLFAMPLYDPNRCSIGFHPLHTYPAIAVYGLLLLPARSRLIAIGLLIHMVLDQIDCWCM